LLASLASAAVANNPQSQDAPSQQGPPQNQNTTKPNNQPGFHGNEKNDTSIDSRVPRNPNNGTWFNSSDASFFLTSMGGRSVQVVSISNLATSAAVLRIDSDPQPRFGIEWARNGSFLNDRTAGLDIAHAVRLVGMHEINATQFNLTDSGLKYQFSNLHWSDFLITTSPLASNGTAIDLQTWAISQGLNITVKAHIRNKISSANNTDPFSIKWDFEVVSANPVPYTMGPNSHFRLINLVHNNAAQPDTVNSTSLTFNSAYLTAALNATADGVLSAVTFAGLLRNDTRPISDQWRSTKKNGTHESDLDFFSSVNLIGWDLPRFTSNFAWDPTTGVSNTQATASYDTVSGSDSKFGGSWLSLAAVSVAAILLF
jgi:hypothetical protein